MIASIDRIGNKELTLVPLGRAMDQTRPPAERRIAARIDIARPARIILDAEERHARTVNISTSGVLVGMAGELPIWAEVAVALPGIDRRFARVVRRDGERYGLVFREQLSALEFTRLTGIELVEDVPDHAAPTGPVPRVAPHAFGRDKVKEFRRLAAEHVRPDRR